VYIPSYPKEIDGNIVVEFAVVATSADGTPVVVPSKGLVDIIKKNAAEIGQKLGGTIVETKRKSAPINKKKKPTSQTQTKRQNAGLIAGVTVAVGLLVIIIVFAIWYFRSVSYLRLSFRVGISLLLISSFPDRLSASVNLIKHLILYCIKISPRAYKVVGGGGGESGFPVVTRNTAFLLSDMSTVDKLGCDSIPN